MLPENKTLARGPIANTGTSSPPCVAHARGTPAVCNPKRTCIQHISYRPDPDGEREASYPERTIEDIFAACCREVEGETPQFRPSLRLRRWKSSRRVPRSRRFASFDSLAPLRAVPPCLRSSEARRKREDGRGRKEGKVGWYFGRNGRRTPSARASPAIGMKRERRFPEWSIAVENLSPRFLGNEQPAGARRRFYRGGRVQSFIEPEGPLRLVENWNRHAPNFSKFQGGGGKMHPPPSSSIRIRGRSRKRYLRVSNFSLFNRVWANV